MRRRLAVLTGGYIFVLLMIVGSVLPFAVAVIHVTDTLQRQLGPAQTGARDFLDAALDQQTAVRGYVVSGDATLLKGYEDGARRAADAQAALGKLRLRTNERNALRALDSSLARWQHDSAEPQIALVRSGRRGDAQAAARSETDTRLFDKVRADQTLLLGTVRDRLAVTRPGLKRNSITVIIVLLIASALAAIFGILMRRWAYGALKREEEQNRHRAAYTEVHRLGSRLAARDRMNDVAEVAVGHVAELLGAEPVHLWVASERDRLRLAGATGGAVTSAPSALARSDSNAPADAIRENRAIFFEDRDSYARAYPGWAWSLDAQGAQSVAVLPTRGDRSAIGALVVFYREPQSFDEPQRTLLELAADQIGSALERAQTREREHTAAATLQDSLLGPTMLVDGVGHTSRYLPAEATLHVGGDWHNAQRLSDGRILIAVGDAVGRGLEAATVMGQLRSAVSACAPQCRMPAELLRCLDDFASEIPGAISTTVAIAFVDVEQHTLDYVCAGHPPPVLISPEGETSLLDEAITWPLAIGHARDTRIGASVAFAPGSLVLLYSDGLIERRGETLDDGIARLVDTAREHWRLPLDALCDRILEGCLRGRRRDDDVALLALRSPAATRDVFLMKVSATPASVGRVRERLRGWLDARELSPDDQLAVLVSVGEACTNAVEHAYGTEGRNLFRVEACALNDTVQCCVTDNGAWKDNATRLARGNGLAIMRELMDEVVVDRRPTGTAVTLTYRVGVRDESVLLG